MQVVYSGGTNTPSPSPRVQRKQWAQGYGRPFMPGYGTGPRPSVTVCRSPAKDKASSSSDENDSSLRDSIPAMSKPVAITCLVLNILFPGLGTFVSGLSVLCCSKIRIPSSTKPRVVWVNTWVALLQFVTTFLLLLGWLWSIVWGAAFITLSEEYYKSLDGTKEQKSSDKRNGNDSVSARQNGARPIRQMYSRSDDALVLAGTSNSHRQPIIVLQEAPLSNQEDTVTSPTRPILNAKTRHLKNLRRQMSDNKLSPFNLTQAKLQEIVIHDVPMSTSRGRLRRDDSTNSEPSPSSFK